MRKNCSFRILSIFIVVVLIISGAMIPVLAGSLSISQPNNPEPEKSYIKEPVISVSEQSNDIEPSQTSIESEDTATNSKPSTIDKKDHPNHKDSSQISEDSEQLESDVETQNGSGCENCIDAAIYAIDYAKEQEWSNRPLIKDYLKIYPLRPVKAFFLWINGTRAWMGDFIDAAEIGFQQVNYTPGYNLAQAIQKAANDTINELMDLLNQIPFPLVKTITIIGELFIVFPGRVTWNLVLLCINGNQNTQMQTVELSETIESLETQSSSGQQTQNI